MYVRMHVFMYVYVYVSLYKQKQRLRTKTADSKPTHPSLQGMFALRKWINL